MLCPAIVTVPERGLVLKFAGKVVVTEAGADPPAGDTLIQLESLTEAAHDPPLHPLGLPLTVNAIEAPPAGIVATDVGFAENVHFAGEFTVSVTGTFTPGACTLGDSPTTPWTIEKVRVQEYVPTANPETTGTILNVTGVSTLLTGPLTQAQLPAAEYEMSEIPNEIPAELVMERS